MASTLTPPLELDTGLFQGRWPSETNILWLHILNELWGLDLLPGDSRIPEYTAYYHYFITELDAWRCCADKVTLKTYRDLLQLVSHLKKNTSSPRNRPEILDFFTSGPNSNVRNSEAHAPSYAQCEHSIYLAVRLWLMINVGNPDLQRVFPGKSRIIWPQDKSLKDIISKHFSEKGKSASSIKYTRDLNVSKLEDIGGIKIIWTDHLADHLTFDEDLCSVAVNLFPDNLLDETCQTLALLLPRSNMDCQEWFKRQQKLNLNTIDNLAGNSTSSLAAAEIRMPSNYNYWQERLDILHKAFEDSQPKGLYMFWKDRRNRVQWYTFWIAVVVLILTIVFGLIQSITGILQLLRCNMSYVIGLVPPAAQLGDIIARFWNCDAAIVMRPVTLSTTDTVASSFMLIGRADVAEVVDRNSTPGRDPHAEQCMSGATAPGFREGSRTPGATNLDSKKDFPSEAKSSIHGSEERVSMGHHNRHFAGDQYALSGAWSPPTSKANFCEEDYIITVYIAEFINSLTNLVYVYFALRHMYGPGSHGLFKPKSDFMSISLLVLGISSFLFHASLRQALQFADELAMLSLSWSLLQGILTGRRSSAYDWFINIILAVVFPLFAVFYVWTGKIIYHATAFAVIMVLITVRGHYLFYWRVPRFPEDKCYGWRVRGRKALVFFLVAYALWNIDLEYCAELRRLRERVGLPWAWLFELHGWWHVLTAISASRFMDIVREVQEELRSKKEE
ncbi:hypothetical protein B7463_g10397, partial [Scytalidium lignicola]